MTKEESNKYLYEKAIEGYQFQVKRYNTWTNLYAIFVGACLLAYTNLEGKDNYALIILITIVGLLTSICWLGSFYGYYYWTISWTNILHLREQLYLDSLKKNGENNIPVYCLADNESLKKYGFSTQKITNLFIRIVNIAWGALFLYQIFKTFGNKPLLSSFLLITSVKSLLILLVIFLLILSIIFLFSPYFNRNKEKKKKRNSFCRWLLSDTKSMYKIIKKMK